MTRKEFLRSAAAVVGGGLAVTAIGCRGGGGTATDCGTTIDLNHGHVLTVPKDDATLGVDMTYHIQGSALHDHTVLITAAQFADLAAGNTLSTTSSLDIGGNTHNHTLTVNCA